jgi:hypothetical protein
MYTAKKLQSSKETSTKRVKKQQTGNKPPTKVNEKNGSILC